jgi:hypothetical protein
MKSSFSARRCLVLGGTLHEQLVGLEAIARIAADGDDRGGLVEVSRHDAVILDVHHFALRVLQLELEVLLVRLEHIVLIGQNAVDLHHAARPPRVRERHVRGHRLLEAGHSERAGEYEQCQCGDDFGIHLFSSSRMRRSRRVR